MCVCEGGKCVGGRHKGGIQDKHQMRKWTRVRQDPAHPPFKRKLAPSFPDEHRLHHRKQG